MSAIKLSLKAKKINKKNETPVSDEEEIDFSTNINELGAGEPVPIVDEKTEDDKVDYLESDDHTDLEDIIKEGNFG